MIRIGVLGAGNHSSEVHGPAMMVLKQQQPELFEIAAVCDLNAEAAERYQQRFAAGQTYTDLDEMLAKAELDCLMAVTPIALTERMVTDLLPRGIPMLIEKPPGESAAAAQRLADVAAACGTPHMVSFNRRFAPALVKAREWIAEAPDARKPRLILSRMLRHHRRESDFVMGTAIHQIDAIGSILGRPTAVAARHLPSGVEGVSNVNYQIDFPDDVRADCVVAPDSGSLEETYEIIGAEYSMCADALAGSLVVRQAKQVVHEWHGGADAPLVVTNGTVAETEAFCRAVAGEGPWWPQLADCVASMAVAEAVAAGRTCDL